MADEKQPTPTQAAKQVEAARGELEKAQQVQAQVARGGAPHLVVEVLPDNTVHHGGISYGPGEEFAVEGLTAVGLMTNGHVAPKGLHDGELPDEEERRQAAIACEEKQLEERLKQVRALRKAKA